MNIKSQLLGRKIKTKYEDRPKYSVITPAYNSSRTIDRLFESLRNQTCLDFEIILVDDYSVDNLYESVCRCTQYFPVDVIYIRLQKNVGTGNARNIGLDMAHGEYVIFVDSDDYVDINLFERINLVSNDADIIIFDYYREVNNEQIINETIFMGKKGYMEKNDCLKRISSNICGKVVRKKVIDDASIKFPNIKRFEDWGFVICSIAKASKIYYMKEALYYYVDNINSITHTYPNDGGKYALLAFKYIASKGDILDDTLRVLYEKEVLYSSIKDYVLTGDIDNLIEARKYWDSKKSTINQYVPKKRLLLLWLYKYNMFRVLRLIGRFFKSVNSRIC